MSVAKAALVVFFEPEEPKYAPSYFYSGDLDTLHRIVDVAGAEHCSFFTSHQVLSRLHGSPYWKIDGYVRGWGERRAAVYRPSEKGKGWYNEYKNKQGQVND